MEIRDVAIPPALQDAMSRQAQAEREKAARVTLGAAEKEMHRTSWKQRIRMPAIQLRCSCAP